MIYMKRDDIKHWHRSGVGGGGVGGKGGEGSIRTPLEDGSLNWYKPLSDMYLGIYWPEKVQQCSEKHYRIAPNRTQPKYS